MSSGVVVLTGGVGGAKLILGLQQVLPSERITAIVTPAMIFVILASTYRPIATRCSIRFRAMPTRNNDRAARTKAGPLWRR